LGKLALKGFRDYFVTREAGYVKNSYVFALGVWSVSALVLSLLLYLLIPILPSIRDLIGNYRNFFLLFAGVSIGTWLSFALRRVVLSFSDLAVLEEDRLKPQYRILFMIALSLVIGFFYTHAIEITIGGFKASMGQGSAAFLIGALCGIAERTIASAVSKRADDLAAGIGGATKPADKLDATT
jgi:hypothetical protein